MARFCKKCGWMLGPDGCSSCKGRKLLAHDRARASYGRNSGSSSYGRSSYSCKEATFDGYPALKRSRDGKTESFYGPAPVDPGDSHHGHAIGASLEQASPISITAADSQRPEPCLKTSFQFICDYNKFMLHSAVQVLSNYIPQPISRYSFNYLEMHRLDIEDCFFLCNVNEKWYVIYESDYIDNLSSISKEALRIYGDVFELLHYMPKIDSSQPPVNLDLHNDIQLNTLIYSLPETYLRFVTIEVRPKTSTNIGKIMSYGH